MRGCGVHRAPGLAAVGTDVHLRDVLFTGPGNASQGVAAGGYDLARRWVGDDGLDLQLGVVAVRHRTARLVHGHVPLGHIEAFELVVQDVDAHQPLHRVHAVPARHQQPQRKAVMQGQGLAVHLIGQQRVGMQGLGQGQAALAVTSAGSPTTRRARGRRPRTSPQQPWP